MGAFKYPFIQFHSHLPCPILHYQKQKLHRINWMREESTFWHTEEENKRKERRKGTKRISHLKIWGPASHPSITSCKSLGK